MSAPAVVAALGLAIALGLPALAQAQSGGPFTLADALVRARDSAPEAAAAAARVEATRLAASVAGRPPNPLFEWRTENLFSGVSRSVLPLDVFGEVTQVVELGGKRRAARGVATALLGIAAARQSLTARELAREIAGTYLQAVRLRERGRALSAQATDLAELVRIVGRRVEVGTAPASEVLKLRAEEARTTTELVRTELEAARALATLTARLDVTATLDQLVAPPVPPVPVAADEAGLQQRPDVTAAARTAEWARQARRLEDARGVPDPAVNAGVKRTMGYNTGQVTLRVPIPVFDRNRVARALARGEVRAAELEMAAVARRARGEMLATRAAAERLRAAAADTRARLLEPARGARDAARAAFQTGAVDVMRLVDAERVYTEATLIAIDLDIDAIVAAIEARLASGEDPLP